LMRTAAASIRPMCRLPGHFISSELICICSSCSYN
jgi:hypothetical protein